MTDQPLKAQIERPKKAYLDSPLSFLMITTYYPPYNFGGDGIYIYRLSNELARRGHKVDVVHCTDAYSVLAKTGPKGDYPNHAPICLFSLKSRLGVLSPLLTQQTSYPFAKAAKIKELISKNHLNATSSDCRAGERASG